MKTTDISNPNYFHQVVDCQWACPAHTPVPEYIRLIAERRYTDAYMINWKSNVFPGVLGRTCDRPCEPACRRGRTEEEPVAICRLKRVTADYKNDISDLLPLIPEKKNGKRIACLGAGPASMTVARDLMPLGYEVTIFDKEQKSGGFIRSQIPEFRLPRSVIDEEMGYVLDMGVETRFGEEVTSMKAILDEGFDAIFVGTGAPRGKWLNLDQHEAAGKTEHVHVGIDWLSSVAFGHIEKIGKKVLVIGGGNTAMDCCRTAKRLGGEDVKVVVRSGFEEMKASPWEKEDAMHEDIPIHNFHNPKAYVVENGELKGMMFELVRAEYDDNGRRSLVPTGEPDVFFECDDVLMAVGQENAFPWIERDIGMDFDKWDMPVVDEVTMQSTIPHVFFGGDAAFGPKNIIWAVAHGHQAAISIDQHCKGSSVKDRPADDMLMSSQKMSMHEWSYANQHSDDDRYKVPMVETPIALGDLKLEVELGFDEKLAFDEAQRCLNCDVQTVFTAEKCIECDACIDICPMDCITFTEDEEQEDSLRAKLKVPAQNKEQPLYVQDGLQTGRVMVKDEDVCVHCGLCAERCPTDAWDMQKSFIQVAQAEA